MSTAARAPVLLRLVKSASWAPGAVLLADVAALQTSLLLVRTIRILLASRFTAAIGVEQFLGVAAGILLLPAINYRDRFVPGILIGAGGAAAAQRCCPPSPSSRRIGGLGPSSWLGGVLSRGGSC